VTDPLAALAGRVLLLAEDDYFAMKRLRAAFEAAGAVVAGPAANIPAALALARAERLDAAVLDVNLHGEMIFPVADLLGARGVPFVFATGYDAEVIPARHADVPLLQKPVAPDAVAEALFPGARATAEAAYSASATRPMRGGNGQRIVQRKPSRP
jgi:ActR/RegA family two-component response regulator